MSVLSGSISRSDEMCNFAGGDSTSGSELSLVTPYKWVDWGVEAAHLTERGGRIERKMGEWFRADLNAFAPFDSDNTLFYSNSKQRTIRTGEKFIEGFGSGLPLYYRFQDDSMDPLFNPAYPFMNARLQEKILAEMNAIGGEKGTPEDPYRGILAAIEKITDEIHYMEEVIGFKESPYAGGTLEHLPLNKMSIILNEGKNCKSHHRSSVIRGYQHRLRFCRTVARDFYDTIAEFESLAKNMAFPR